MTVQSETSKVIYSGNGSTTVFSTVFSFFSNTDVKVVLTNTSNVETILSVGTHYTITGAGGASGNITMITAPASGEKLTIYRNPPITQSTDYINGDSFDAETHERALDKLTHIVQAINENVARTIRIPISSPANPQITPEPNKAIGWNSAGDALVNLAVVGGALLGNQDIIGYLKVSDFVSAKGLVLEKNSPSDLYSPIYWRRYNTPNTEIDAFLDFVEFPVESVTRSQSQTATAGQTFFKVYVFVLKAADLQVKVNGTIVTNYTVTNEGYRNGEMAVTFSTAVATGATVLFERINLNNYRPLMSMGVVDPTDKGVKASYIDLSVAHIEFNRGLRLPVNPNMVVTDQVNHIYDCNGVVRHCGEVSAVGVLSDSRGVLTVTKTGTGQYVITCERTFPVAITFAVNPYVISNINAYVSAGSVGTNAFTVQTRNASTNTLVDAAFCFTVFY